MAAKKITIVFLPEGARRVRQFEMPKSVFIFLSFLSLAALIALGWVIKDYQAMKRRVPRLSHLQKENEEQKVQLAALTQKIDLVTKKVAELKKFDTKLRTMVNLSSREDSTQYLGVGGSEDPGIGKEQRYGGGQRMVRMMHRSLDDLQTEILLQTKEKDELHKYMEGQRSVLKCTPSVWPTRGFVSSDFGYRLSPFTNEREFHRGVDICNKMGSSVIATADGVVTNMEWDYGHGRILVINHGSGLKTMYAHLDKYLVKNGQVVKRGQEIATVGNSGRTTGPHLHYEVHVNGVPTNPFRYILN